MLSIVLPIRVGPANEYLLERLEANLALLCEFDDVECIVVDSASPQRFADRVRRLCAGRPRCLLVEDPAPQEPFAPGTTRNVAAQHAAGDFLLSYDVDLCCGAEFVPAVLRWTEASRDPFDFLVVPCICLTKEATERLRPDGRPVDLDPFRASFLAGESHLISNLATALVVVRRRHFLRLGGYRREYRGHGCEDFDLLHRLASYKPRGRRPRDYFVDARRRFPGDYGGFRAYFAPYALPYLFEGLYLAHLWHPRPIRRSYFRRRLRNEALLQELMRRHDAGTGTLAPLPSLRAAEAGHTEPPLPAPWAREGEEEVPQIGDFIRSLMDVHGIDVAANPGLFRFKEGVGPPLAPISKLRKLVLRPREFLADSRLSALRALGRLLTRD